MIKITELEQYFDDDFNTLLKDKCIVEIANNIDDSWKDYCKWETQSFIYYDEKEKEEQQQYLESIETDFYKWVKNCNADDLFNYELNTYQRHFMLENGKIYYLNEI